MMPARLGVSVVLLLGLVLLGAPAAWAQADPMQRYFVFKNDTPFPIYPVISAPKSANCSKGDLSSLRIVVNQGTRGAGIPSEGSVTVALPKSYPCPNGGFYNASRIYVLLANVQGFEEKIDPRQRTSPPLADAPKNLCPNDACWIGQAQADYVGDFPGQLLEYTIISQIGPAASPKGPNDPNGVSVIDFDVSYVDDAYLPVAMALDNGLTGFMGSALPYQDFKVRLTTFLNDPRTDWSAYGVYSQKNWQTRTTFGPGQSPALKVDKIDKLPSGNVVVVGTRAGTIGFSPYYANNSPANPDTYNFPACNDGVHNLACSKFDSLTSGDCCPNQPLAQGGTQLGCCDIKNYLIDRTIGRFIGAGSDGTNRIPLYSFTNPTFDNIMSRWQKWRQRTYKCQNNPPTTSAVDGKAFCSAFQKTFDFVWNEFHLRGKCGSLSGKALDECVTAAILGYDLEAASPQKCKACPAQPCPQQCVTDIQRNESVQALLRSVPWTPAGDPKQCTGCPSPRANECPLPCVAPPTYAPKATLWHRDLGPPGRAPCAMAG